MKVIENERYAIVRDEEKWGDCDDFRLKSFSFEVES